MAFEDHIEVLLDEALEATFPASDPLALVVAAERWRADQEPMQCIAEETSDGHGNAPATLVPLRTRTQS